MAEMQKKIVWENDSVAVGELVNDNGEQINNRSFVELKNKVALIVPIDGDNVYLLKEYRSLMGKTVWRVPAGHLDGDEGPLDGGARELLEETGLTSNKLTLLGQYDYMGWVKFPMSIVKAEELTQHEQHLELYEKIDLVKVTREEARKIALDEMAEPHHAFALLKALE